MRPKVCKSKPPVDAPKPTIECSVTPQTATMPSSDIIGLEFAANNPAFDTDIVVTIEADAGIGMFDFGIELLNGGTSDGTYMADIGPYEEERKITYRWPDDTACEVTVTYTVENGFP